MFTVQIRSVCRHFLKTWFFQTNTFRYFGLDLTLTHTISVYLGSCKFYTLNSLPPIMKDIQFSFYYLKLPVPNLQCALFCCLWRCTWNKGLSTLCIRPSCNFHIFKLLRNHLTDFNESIQKASTLCPVPSLCFSKDDCMPCLWLVEKFFLLLRNVFQKMILNRKQILPILYVLKIFARADLSTKMATLDLWSAETFSTSPLPRANAERILMKLYKKQVLNIFQIFMPPDCCSGSNDREHIVFVLLSI